MRRILMMAGLSLAVAMVAGCRPTYPNCKSDEHCQEKGEVCVNGTCQECATDANCKEGFACKGNKCAPKDPECTTDEACGEGRICEGGKCARAQCTGDDQCGSNQRCERGRCVLRPDACNTNTDCPEGKECQAGLCVAAGPKCNWEPLRFGFNEANLTPEAQSQLAELVACLKGEGAVLTLAGHADERGTEEYNLQLSQKRAAAVKKYLVDLGVKTTQLKTVGYGENRPVESSSGEDAWAANRRVEFVR